MSTTSGSNSSNSTGFDPSSVPYPSKHEITKPYGGMHYFMLSYGLKMWNDEDLEEAKAILEELRKSVYEDRVETAREKYEAEKGN